MAKRTRYPNRTTPRPAAKRPARPEADTARSRPTARPTGLDSAIQTAGQVPAPSTAGLTEAEERRAAELEAEATAQERAAIADSLRRRSRAQQRDTVEAGDINAPLSVRAAHEYAYVARDVKRIALTASLMIAILAILHVLVNVMGIISL